MPQATDAVPELELGFYLFGDLPEPPELERIFEVRAVVSHRAGDPRLHRISGEQTGVHSQAVWGFTTRHIQSNEMQPHAEWLLSAADPARELLGSRPSAVAYIELALTRGSSTVLPLALVEFAGKLKAEIGFVVRGGHAA